VRTGVAGLHVDATAGIEPALPPVVKPDARDLPAAAIDTSYTDRRYLSVTYS